VILGALNKEQARERRLIDGRARLLQLLLEQTLSLLVDPAEFHRIGERLLVVTRCEQCIGEASMLDPPGRIEARCQAKGHIGAIKPGE